MVAAMPFRTPNITTKFLCSDFETPFRTVEEAWFWTLALLSARRDSGGCAGSAITRPCDPDDVINCLDRLFRNQRIDLTHARILRIWGDRGVAPDPVAPHSRADWRIWREAMDRLELPLREKGIVAELREFFPQN